MHASVIERTRVFLIINEELLSVVKRQMNKDWERPVPAAAVIPAVQVATLIIGSKTSVARLVSFL